MPISKNAGRGGTSKKIVDRSAKKTARTGLWTTGEEKKVGTVLSEGGRRGEREQGEA